MKKINFKYSEFIKKERCSNNSKHYFYILKCNCSEIYQRRHDIVNEHSVCKNCTNKKKKKETNRNQNFAQYSSWSAMIQRCTNPNNISYKNYGGRGIKVCKRWLKFENFFADMKQRPKGTTLDRINNDGDYCPENCRWATPTEQHRNTRSNRIVMYEGKEYCIAELAAKYKINHNVLLYRIYTAKWPIERALGKSSIKIKSSG